MIVLPGYQILVLLYQSSNSFVYCAQRESDGQSVILKVFNQKYPTPEESTRYKQEYQITKDLKLEGAIAAYNLQKYENTMAIAFEDFGGQSLDLLIKERQLSVGEFLSLGIKITEALGAIHAANIIHKDINPSNLVYNSQTGQLKIIDFGISTVLPRENPTLKNPRVIEGTLAYISPEQTGRMNRSLDYRTDFYSLGVTFYELLTGKLPFLDKNNDLLELLHAHLVLDPPPPHLVNSRIPPVLSKIVMKLMDKDPEKRYQSAWGIKADLQKCVEELDIKGKIDNFFLGKQDVTDQLQIPQKLYGREQEIDTLLAAFERISLDKEKQNSENNSAFSNEIILVAGYSGIGKSALVREIYKPVTKSKGFFVAGKFDQYQRNIPYSAIIQALQQLVRYLLQEPDSTLIQWRKKLMQALGVNGQVIIDVIPEMELIIGSQPPVPSVSLKESQNRFSLVFTKFIEVLAGTDHPLVIFLDDLQWADGASLKLLEQLISCSEISHLLLIGAYRDNEVDEAHPLMVTIRKVKDEGAAVHQITLLPLKLFDINQLIADTLKSNTPKTLSLAKLIESKTAGNPFFINEFLRSLYTEKLLNFDYPNLCWQWNTEFITTKGITDNVVELLSNKIQRLSQETQELLQLAACIGNQFELGTLAVVFQKTTQETAILLREAIVEGLVVPLSDAYKSIELEVTLPCVELVEYKFVHDRVQQAAYALIDEQTKPMRHRQVGQILLDSIPSEQLEEKIFDIVNQLNQSIPLIDSQEERDKLAQLNLIAGKRAKKAAAFEPAFEYFKFCMGLLRADSWQLKYELTLELYAEAVETAYLTSNYDLMELIGQDLQQYAKTSLDRMRLYEVKIAAYKGQNKLFEAIEIAISALKQLGIVLPKRPTKLDVLLALIETKLTLAGKSIEDLTNISAVTDPSKLAIMHLLDALGVAGYLVVPELFALVVFKGVKLMVEYGDTSLYLRAFSGYGAFLIGVSGDIDSGYKYGQLSLTLLQKFNIEEQKCKLLGAFNGLISFWKNHLKETLLPLLEGYQSGIEIGEFEFAAFNILFYCYNLYFLGKQLNDIEREIATYIKVLTKLKQKTSLYALKIFHQSTLIFKGGDDLYWIISNEIYEQEEAHPQMLSCFLHINKLIVYYAFDEDRLALESAILAEKHLVSVMSMSIVPVFYLYDSLARIKILSSSKPKQKKLIKKVVANQKRMKNWAHHAPMNYLHKYYLVEAELCRVVGKDKEARDLYDRAIALAKENEYINEAALAYELCAKFYFSRKNYELGEFYLKNACYYYERWGAIAKVQALKKQYPTFLSQARNAISIKTTKSLTNTSSSFALEELDIETLLKTSNAIYKEQNLDELLRKILNFVLQDVGAQRGIIILEKQGEIVVEAAGRSENNQISIVLFNEAEENLQFSQSIVNYVYHSRENLVLDNAWVEGLFINDEYIISNQIKSVLCLPLQSGSIFIGSLYLENNLISGAFNEGRLEVLKLISSQVTLSIENALLRQKQSNQVYEYQVGGSLSADSPSYIKRQADEDLYKALKQGHFCYIFNSRQVGKSSLRKRITNQLQQEGWVCATVDLIGIKTHKLTIEQWYATVIRNLARSFQLSEKFNMRSWWDSLNYLPPIERFREFIVEILLKEIEQHIVIFIDEIDTVLSLDFPMDDFFALIRSFYNSRGDYPGYERLSFVLLGVATPSSLIQDKLRTPFNIGRAIALSGFKLHEVKPLILGFASRCSEPEHVMREVLSWTGGQPFLTQRLCELITKSQVNIEAGKEVELIESLVESEIIQNWSEKDTLDHFKTIENRLTKNQLNPVHLLELYQKIWIQGELEIKDSPERRELLLSGLVYLSGGKLKIYNPIYQRIFNNTWIEDTLDEVNLKFQN